MTESFSAFLYRRQRGRCFLRVTQECAALDGYLHPDQLLKGARSERGWTWEHVIPRWLARRIMHPPASLRLLACSPCNQAKASGTPNDEHIRVALGLHREYHGANGTRAGDVEKLVGLYAQFVRREIEIVVGVSDDDMPVPRSVEEALAQGGIYVAAPSPVRSR